MTDDAARRFRVIDPEPSGRAPAPVDPTAANVATRIRFALDELARVDASADAGRQAGELLADIARLTEADSESFEGRKRELWAAVANARTAVRREQTTPEVGPVVSPRIVERIHELDDAVVVAQAKANRKLASPGAYRKLIEAKKELAAALADAGFESVEDLDLATGGESQAEAPEDRARRIRGELEAAEAAWEAFEAQEPGALPVGTEGEALRARAYRVLGEVVDDDELHVRLTDLEARGRRGADALAVLEGALRDAGFDPGEDAVALGQLYLRAQ